MSAGPLSSRRVGRRLAAFRIGAWLIVVLTMFVAILAADYATGVELALRAFFVVPVGVAAWFVGRSAGGVVALLSVSACVLFDYRGHLTESHRAILYSDAAARGLTYLGLVVVLDRLRNAYAQLDKLAHDDALTGIKNLRGFRSLAQREIDRARRFGTVLTIVYMDLDGFKAVNDTRGHAEGDRVLVAVAKALSSGRALDISARLGGDEFVLLLPDTDRVAAQVAVARIVEKVRVSALKHRWPITLSVGSATFLTPPESVEDALRHADALTYEVKRSKKNSVRFEEVSTPAAAIEQLTLPSNARIPRD